jgi:hypothetical protein
MDCSWGNPNGENMKKGLEQIPKFVFCKDCIYWNKETGSCLMHDNPFTGYRKFESNDFCSRGSRKET